VPSDEEDDTAFESGGLAESSPPMVWMRAATASRKATLRTSSLGLFGATLSRIKIMSRKRRNTTTDLQGFLTSAMLWPLRSKGG
tara:strand:+ start:108 stop:359 length:252 start_codon:yes stop_codon:yes gene_type:complete